MIKTNLQLFAGDDEEEFNPLENFENFVGEEEEVEQENDEQVEEQEIKEPETPAIEDKKQTEPNDKKAEFAWGKLKKENTSLKIENQQLNTLIDAMNKRLEALENSENDRSLDVKRKQLIQSYVDDDGFDEKTAAKLAERDIKHDQELSILKRQVEEIATGKKTEFEMKTQTEQSILYKQAKANQSKVDPVNAPKPQLSEVKLTSEQKQLWDMVKKTPWGKNKSINDFLKDFKDSFG